jgi:Glyoxalase/Bleomycin resistance protein/Dioxygenase superfamily
MNGKGLLGKLDATDAQVEEAAKVAEINDFIFLINTSLTGKASHNVAFYTQVLGMRLTKKTVNQDDVSAYHLFYGDELGRPGTEFPRGSCSGRRPSYAVTGGILNI